MSWLGYPLSTDEASVAELVTALLERNAALPRSDAPELMASLRQCFADAGVWCLGAASDLGGGDAPLGLRQIALVAMGRRRAALAWGSAQAHAAVELLVIGKPEGELAALARGITAGKVAACVVDLSARHLAVETSADTTLRCEIQRLDPAGGSPYVLLTDGDIVWVVEPQAVRWGKPTARTGMPGAMTAPATIDAQVGTNAWRFDVADANSVLARLYLGGAAVAAGLAVEAATRSLDYSAQRVQFGGPLIDLPTVRQSLFEQVGSALAALILAIRTSGEDLVASAGALDRGCESAITVGTAAVQSLGGYGYLAEYEVEGLLRDAVSLRAATACSDVARQAAKRLVDRTVRRPWQPTGTRGNR